MADLVTLITALAGWLLAILLAFLNYRQKSEEMFFQSLGWLGGDIQKRSLGIAAIEANWSNRRFRNFCIPLLCNSAIYILLVSEHQDAEHELDNLHRIMYLLLSTKSIKTGYQIPLNDLWSATEKAKMPNRNRGLKVPPDTLEAWSKQLQLLLGKH